uniref:Uncharacterized protein n=1 Tax=Triticum urartu TaxID=4572 RepID=A0A8R7UDR4_TRIUA
MICMHKQSISIDTRRCGVEVFRSNLPRSGFRDGASVGRLFWNFWLRFSVIDPRGSVL